MNWGRAKTILIVMFFVVDVFLLGVLMQTRKGAIQIPEETVQATIQILQENGILANVESVPVVREKNQNVIMGNYFENPIQVAETMLKTFETECENAQEHLYDFKSDMANLHIKDTYFEYQNHKEQKLYEQGEEGAEKAAFKQLKKLGFKGNEMTLAEGRIENGLFVGKVLPLYKGKKIHGIAMQVVADKEAVVSLSGNWFRTTEVESFEQEPLLDVTAVLADLIYREDGWPKQIKQIEKAFYAADEFLNSREISVVPVYAVMDMEGQIKCFDARVGSEIE